MTQRSGWSAALSSGSTSLASPKRRTRAVRAANRLFVKEQQEDAKLDANAESGDLPPPHRVLGTTRIIFAVLFPLALPLLFVSTINLILYWIAVAGWFTFCVAYFITEVAFRPPWYHPTSPEEGLTQQAMPDYWRGVTNNPMEDLGIPFEEVSFPSANGCILRGWYIRGADSHSHSHSHSSSHRSTKQRARSRPQTPRRSRQTLSPSPTPRRRRNPEQAEQAEQEQEKNVPAPNKNELRPQEEAASTATPPASRHCIVFCHGGGRDRRAFLRHAECVYQAGYDALLFDMAEHGVSDGTGQGLSFGLREWRDVISAAQFVGKEKGVRSVVLMGTSVGGASAIIAAYNAQPKDNIVGVVAENPLARPGDLMRFHLARTFGNYLPPNKHAPAFSLRNYFFSLCVRTLLLRLGLRLFDVGAVDLVSDIKVPIYTLHGTADDVIPVSHGICIHEAASEPKRLWVIEGGMHCSLFDTHKDEYVVRLMSFLESCFH